MGWDKTTQLIGVFYAYVLNGERPTLVQGIAFFVIMTGVVISSFSTQPKMAPKESLTSNSEGPASAS